MKIIPLASRLTPKNERKNFGVDGLIGENDWLYVNNVVRTLFEYGFDTYLGGEVVENAIVNKDSYSKIDIFALTEIKSNGYRFVADLVRLKEVSGSEQWKHFGFTTQKQVGWKTKNYYHGNWFYCLPIEKPDEISEFKLESAIHDAKKVKPSPIHLHFLSSLEGFKII